MHAQKAGALGIIVGDDKSSERLVVMSPGDDEDEKDLYIPAVFVSQPDYNQLLNWKKEGKQVNVTLDSRGEKQDEDLTALLKYASALRILSIVLMVIPSLWCILAALVIFRRVSENQRNRRRRLLRLAHIPTVVYRSSLVQDRKHPQHLHNSSCAICLDEFENGLEIKRLDCSHAFHSTCIDPWLENRSDLCPICKRSILEGYDSEAEEHIWTRVYQRITRCCRRRRNNNNNQDRPVQDLNIESQESALLVNDDHEE